MKKEPSIKILLSTEEISKSNVIGIIDIGTFVIKGLSPFILQSGLSVLFTASKNIKRPPFVFVKLSQPWFTLIKPTSGINSLTLIKNFATGFVLLGVGSLTAWQILIIAPKIYPTLLKESFDYLEASVKLMGENKVGVLIGGLIASASLFTYFLNKKVLPGPAFQNIAKVPVIGNLIAQSGAQLFAGFYALPFSVQKVVLFLPNNYIQIHMMLLGLDIMSFYLSPTYYKDLSKTTDAFLEKKPIWKPIFKLFNGGIGFVTKLVSSSQGTSVAFIFYKKNLQTFYFIRFDFIKKS